jgi:hypothetical protein
MDGATRGMNWSFLTVIDELIFPWLEDSRQQIKDANLKTEVAGTSYLDLIEYMRKIILQDAAILCDKEEFKNLPLFQHEVFEPPLTSVRCSLQKSSRRTLLR